MTVTELLAEICNRAGEGYQNYSERAGQIFKSAVLSMLYGGSLKEKDAPGLIRSGSMIMDAEGTYIPLFNLLSDAGLDEGSILNLEYLVKKAKERKQRSLLIIRTDNRKSHKVYALNPNILQSKNDVAFYKMNGTGTEAQIEFVMPDVYEADSTIKYTLIGWSDTFITPVMDGDTDISEVGTLLSPLAFEQAILMASLNLVKEIMA
jgi:hypothetical protein